MKVKPNPQSKDDVVNNPYSWNANANLLFVDQPVGTGFSYSRWPLDYVTNEVQVAQQLYDFLQAFIVQYPEFAERQLFITGESYAGHYVPAIGWKIVDANAEGGQPQLNLQGIAIGAPAVNISPARLGVHGWLTRALACVASRQRPRRAADAVRRLQRLHVQQRHDR